MEQVRRTLRMFGNPSPESPLDWAWVEERLTTSEFYWVCPVTAGRPHPRPVWGEWDGTRLHLSIGSQVILRALSADPRVTVHLGSGTDVVIPEGSVLPTGGTDSAALDAYNAKYDWDHEVENYGDLTCIEPGSVLAWRAVGDAGRDGFGETGSWDFR